MYGKDWGLCGDFKIDLVNAPPPGGHPALKSPRNPHYVGGVLCGGVTNSEVTMKHDTYYLAGESVSYCLSGKMG